MNVCICTSSFPINRQEVFHRYLEDLINSLGSNGHKVTVLTQNKRGIKELFIPGIDVVWFPWKMTKKEVLAEVSFKTPASILSALSLVYNGIRHALKVQKAKNIDVFLCLWIVPSGLFICLKNVFGTKRPYLLWSLGSDVYNNKDNFLTRSLLRFIIKRSKAVFADGFELCEIIKEISNRKCTFLPTFHKVSSEFEAVKSKKNEQISFLFIGRLSQVKGPDVLIDALRLLDPSLDYKCYIIGDGEMMNDLVNKSKQSSLDGKVFFLGKITDQKIKADYFNLSDCVIIPSRSESIPVVLSEAVQYSKPLIVTDAGDMKLITQQYHLGLVAEKENPRDLAAKIEEFIMHPVIINQMDRQELLSALLFATNAHLLLDSIDKA